MSGGGAASSVLVLFFGSLLCAYLVYHYAKKHRLVLTLDTLKPPQDWKQPLWRKIRGDVLKALQHLSNHRERPYDEAPLMERKFNNVGELVEACYSIANANFAYFQISMFVLACIQLILCGIVAPGWGAITLFAIVWVMRAFALFLSLNPLYPVFRVSRLYGISNAISLIGMIVGLIAYIGSDSDNIAAFVIFLICAGMSKVCWLWTTVSVNQHNIQYTNMFITLGSYTASASANKVTIPIGDFVGDAIPSSYVPPEFVPPSQPPPSHESGNPAHYSYPPQNAVMHASYPPPQDPRYSYPPQQNPDPRYSYPPQPGYSPHLAQGQGQGQGEQRLSQPPPQHDPRFSYPQQQGYPQNHDPRYSGQPYVHSPQPPHLYSRPPSMDYAPPRSPQPHPPANPPPPRRPTSPPPPPPYAPPLPPPDSRPNSLEYASPQPYSRPPSIDYMPPQNNQQQQQQQQQQQNMQTRPPSIDYVPPPGDLHGPPTPSSSSASTPTTSPSPSPAPSRPLSEASNASTEVASPNPFEQNEGSNPFD